MHYVCTYNTRPARVRTYVQYESSLSQLTSVDWKFTRFFLSAAEPGAGGQEKSLRMNFSISFPHYSYPYYLYFSDLSYWHLQCAPPFILALAVRSLVLDLHECMGRAFLLALLLYASHLPHF